MALSLWPQILISSGFFAPVPENWNALLIPTAYKLNPYLSVEEQLQSGKVGKFKTHPIYLTS
jgi:hypothetical protein